MKCPKCHSDNPETATFCADCGTKISLPKDVAVTETIETPKEELTTGSTFAARYQIIEELGKGGMGKVYRALDKKLNEEVALKLIKPEIASDKKMLERFSNELKLARKISHRNVGRMYELLEEKGTHYITMEYVPGEDLKSFIRRSGQLAVGTTLRIARQVCEGLAEAHNLGVVHRDLKPSNIMIDKEGNARIMDFGIARAVREKGITGAGVMIGTPEYMSPEQAEVKEVDQRSDIYSLGVILYEAVTGILPFEGDTPLSIAMKHKGEIPKDPREFNAQISEDLSQIILKCLEKNRKDRYQNTKELFSELSNIERAIPTLERVITERKRIPAKKINVRSRLVKAIFLVLIVYGIISVISLINDAIYKGKFEKIRVEHDTHYKNLYPIQKDWLPGDWEIRNCNACNIYRELFPPRVDEEGNLISEEEYLKSEYVRQITENPPSEKLDKIFNDYEYKNTQELETFMKNYGIYYKFDELFNAARCTRLNAYQKIDLNWLYNYKFIIKYIKMVVLEARGDFFEGNYERGLMRIQNALVFNLDLRHISNSLVEDLLAATCFKWLCRELLPLFLSDEINYNQNIIKNLEKLISLTLTKLESESGIYNEYLMLGDIRIPVLLWKQLFLYSIAPSF